MRIPQPHNAVLQVLLHREFFDLDITNRVVNASVQTGDVSNVGTRATGADGAATILRLTLDGEMTSAAPDLSPANPLSTANQPSPLLSPYRPVTVRAGTGGQLQSTLFKGYLGADVTVSSYPEQRRTITVTAQDLTKPLRDYFITTPTDLAPTNSTIDQVVLNSIALLPVELRPNLVVIGNPAFAVTNYTVTGVSLWQALITLVGQVGWWLGAIGDELVLMAPPRDQGGVDRNVDWDDAWEDNASMTDAHVRNRVTVKWPGGSITKTNQDSVDEWSGGLPRAAVIGRDSNDEPGPSNQTQAEALADAFLHDLAEPLVSSRLELPFLPDVTVFSRLGLNNPLYSNQPRLVSVTSVQHTWSGSDYRTVVLGTGRSAGSQASWMAGGSL